MYSRVYKVLTPLGTVRHTSKVTWHHDQPLGKFLPCLKLHVADWTRNQAQGRMSQASWGQAAKVYRDRRPIAPKQGAKLSRQYMAIEPHSHIAT